MAKQLTKEQALEAAFDLICEMDIWGCKDDAPERLHYVSGVQDMTNAIVELLEGDKK